MTRLPPFSDLTSTLLLLADTRSPPPTQYVIQHGMPYQISPVFYQHAAMVSPPTSMPYTLHNVYHQPNYQLVPPSVEYQMRRDSVISVKQEPRRTSSSRKLSPSMAQATYTDDSGVLETNINFPIRTDLSLLPPLEAAKIEQSVIPNIVKRKYLALALPQTGGSFMVFEYPVGLHWVIWDYDSGFVHLTGLWRAALERKPPSCNQTESPKLRAKADMVKLLELAPQALHEHIRRVRGGFLKIQGTWIPHLLCLQLARRFCYYIRYELVPIFGPEFPNQCLAPHEAGFGELRFDQNALNVFQEHKSRQSMVNIPQHHVRAEPPLIPFPGASNGILPCTLPTGGLVNILNGTILAHPTHHASVGQHSFVRLLPPTYHYAPPLMPRTVLLPDVNLMQASQCQQLVALEESQHTRVAGHPNNY